MTRSPRTPTPALPFYKQFTFWFGAVEALLLFAAAAAVYVLAGGTAESVQNVDVDPAGFVKPAAASFATFFGYLIVSSLTSWGIQLDQRRAARVRKALLAARLPSPASRLVEQLVKDRGPLSFAEINQLLAEGGPWGPPAQITAQAVHRLLKDQTGAGPAEWLAPRQPGEPYQHRDTVTASATDR